MPGRWTAAPTVWRSSRSTPSRVRSGTAWWRRTCRTRLSVAPARTSMSSRQARNGSHRASFPAHRFRQRSCGPRGRPPTRPWPLRFWPTLRTTTSTSTRLRAHLERSGDNSGNRPSAEGRGRASGARPREVAGDFTLSTTHRQRVRLSRVDRTRRQAGVADAAASCLVQVAHMQATNEADTSLGRSSRPGCSVQEDRASLPRCS